MKYLASVFLFGISLFQAPVARAQYFYSPGDSAEMTKTVTYDADELDIYIYFHNNSSNPVKLIWRLLEDSVPTDWTIGVCDNVACYLNFNNSLYQAKTSDDIAPGDTAFLKAVFTPNCTSGEGWIRLSSKVEDGGFRSPDTLFYKATATAQCPSGISDKDPVASLNVFPNPVTEYVTVTSTMMTALPLKIQITDLQGRHVSQVQPFNMSATINIQSLPSGAYLLQVLEPDNRTVSIRKIFKL